MVYAMQQNRRKWFSKFIFAFFGVFSHPNFSNDAIVLQYKTHGVRDSIRDIFLYFFDQPFSYLLSTMYLQDCVLFCRTLLAQRRRLIRSQRDKNPMTLSSLIGGGPSMASQPAGFFNTVASAMPHLQETASRSGH